MWHTSTSTILLMSEMDIIMSFDDAVGIANFFCRTISTADWWSRWFIPCLNRASGFSGCFLMSFGMPKLLKTHLCITTSPEVKWSFSRRYPHPWLHGIPGIPHLRQFYSTISDVRWDVVNQDVTHVFLVWELHNNSHTHNHVWYIQTNYMNLHDWCQVLLVYVEVQSSISRSSCIMKLMIRLVVSGFNHANFIADILKDVNVWTSFWKFWKLVVLLTTAWLKQVISDCLRFVFTKMPEVPSLKWRAKVSEKWRLLGRPSAIFFGKHILRGYKVGPYNLYPPGN